MKLLSAILCLTVALMGGACGRLNVLHTPTGVTSAQVADWDSAVNALQSAQALTHAAFIATRALNQNHQLPDAQYVVVLTGIGRAEQLEIEAAQFLKTVPNSWSAATSAKVLVYSQQILTQLAAATSSGVLNLKDPISGQVVQDMINNVVHVIQLFKSSSTSLFTEGGLAHVA